MKNLADVSASLVLISVGIGAIVGGIGLQVGTPTEPQPGFFPFLSGVSIAFLSSVLFVRGLLGRRKKGVPFGEVRRPALLVVVLFLFVGGLEPLGYIISTPIAAGLLLRIMGIKSWRVLILISLMLSIGTYLLFDRLLGITLPVGLLSYLRL